jgi:hypothetical protein
MRNLVRGLVLAITMTALVGMPVAAATGKAVGSITQAKGAQMGTAAAVPGATVYAGDSLTTSVDGSLRLRMGGGQFYLLPSSGAAVNAESSRLTAEVTHGSAVFSFSSVNGFVVETPHSVIHAQTAQATHGRVTIVNENEVVVTSDNGPLMVEADGDTYTIPAGTSYRVVSTPNLAQDAQTQGGTMQGNVNNPNNKKKVSRHTTLILVGLGVAIAGVSIGIAEAYSSPSKP